MSHKNHFVPTILYTIADDELDKKVKKELSETVTQTTAEQNAAVEANMYVVSPPPVIDVIYT